jgi:hypothetical protein
MTSRVPIALALGALLALPAAGAAAPAPVTAAQFDATQQIAQTALRKVALLEASLEGRPASDPALAGKGGIVRVTAAQLRTNQRMAQAAIRRAAALEARLAGEPAPKTAPGRRDVIRLTAKQAAITRKIAEVAMRRANALAKRVPYQHLAVELELSDRVRVRSADLNDAGHAAIGMLVGDGPAAAVRHGALGRWRTGTLASASGDRTVGFGPMVRVNGRGAALAVWSTSGGEVVAARREPGGRWSTGSSLGLDGVTALGIGDDGVAHVIGDGGPAWAQAAPGAPWAELPTGRIVPGPIALNRRGGAVAAWKVDGPGPAETRASEVLASTLGPDGWGVPEVVARTEAGAVADEIAVALGEGGEVTVAWGLYRDASPLDGGLFAVSRSAEGTWGSPVELRPRGPLVRGLSVAIGDRGATVVAWRDLDFRRAVAAFRLAGATSFESPATLLAVGPDDSAQSVEPIAHPAGDRPAVLLKTEGHAGTVNWARAGSDGPPIWAPFWSGTTDEAAAVAANGAILAAGPVFEDHETLHIESRSTD